MKRLKTSCEPVLVTCRQSGALSSHLDSADVGILRSILVLVKAILGQLSSSKIDAQFDEEDHHRLKGGDGVVSGPLRHDMFVKERQRSLLLADPDEFLSTLENILRPAVWWWRHLVAYHRQQESDAVVRVLFDVSVQCQVSEWVTWM